MSFRSKLTQNEVTGSWYNEERSQTLPPPPTHRVLQISLFAGRLGGSAIGLTPMNAFVIDRPCIITVSASCCRNDPPVLRGTFIFPCAQWNLGPSMKSRCSLWFPKTHQFLRLFVLQLLGLLISYFIIMIQFRQADSAAGCTPTEVLLLCANMTKS